MEATVIHSTGKTFSAKKKINNKLIGKQPVPESHGNLNLVGFCCCYRRHISRIGSTSERLWREKKKLL